MREVNVVVLPGDGIGPEVISESIRAVEIVAKDADLSITWREELMGGCSIDVHGTALTDEVLAACQASDAVFLGAVGGPKWDTTDPSKPRPEQGLLGLRSGMQLFANLRPVKPLEALWDASPLRRDRIAGTDLLVVRELTGGIYFGASGRDGDSAFDTCTYSRAEIERVAEVAFAAANGRRKKVASVDKANVLESSRLWREVVTEVGARHPEIELEHILVDNAAMQLINRPSDFDVIVTENLFGDILSDEAAMITGSIGLLPSASLGTGVAGLYEPVHGSAPDIAGKGWANPMATVLSAALMLRYSLGAPEAADRLENAVAEALNHGAWGRDLGGELGTTEIGDRLCALLAR